MAAPAVGFPWHAPAWDAGAGGSVFVPGFVREIEAFRVEVVLQNHPLRDELI